MADVKWIKITTDIFDDEKILMIEAMPDAYAIIVVWFKLLCLAGKQNNSGVFIMANAMPYTDEMLAAVFRMKEMQIELALQTFEKFGMIERIDGVITIPNWGKHQNIDKMQDIREYNRIAKQKQRAKQKNLLCVNDRSMTSQPCQDTDIDKDIDKEKEEDKEREDIRVDYKSVVDLYNRLCPSFPYVKSISEARKKAIKARLRTYKMEDFETLFRKAEASSFLKGGNDRNWSATFDWLISDGKMAKVLDGNYDDRPSSAKAGHLNKSYQMLEEWARGEEA